MREQMGYMLLEYASLSPHDAGSMGNFSGVSEILEILGSIIVGFAVPLKQTNVEFLHQVLLPLVKRPSFVLYSAPLLVCLQHYLVKDSSLAPAIVKYFFRHWPVQTARKQIVMLNTIEALMGDLDMQGKTSCFLQKSFFF